MKQNILRGVRTVVFLLLFCVMFARVSEILRAKSGNGIDRVHSFFSIEEDTLDVLVLGSSHAYYGFSPNELWGEYGITSYVMGSPAQTEATSYFLLKEAIRHQKPKVVLLESYSFKYDALYTSEANLRRAFDGIPFGKVKLEMVDELLSDLDFSEKLSYYIPFLKYHDRWKELEKTDFEPNRTWLKGATLTLSTYSFEDPGMEITPVEIPEGPLSYFERTVELCRENDIELIVFAAPMAFQKQSAYTTPQGINLSLETYLTNEGIPFLFYQKENNIGIDFAADLTETGHLNLYGQQKVTWAIGEYLTENYGFEDHRGDAAYAEWEEDYQTYLQKKNALEEKAAEAKNAAEEEE